jgi:hypothetical protein
MYTNAIEPAKAVNPVCDPVLHTLGTRASVLEERRVRLELQARRQVVLGESRPFLARPSSRIGERAIEHVERIGRCRLDLGGAPLDVRARDLAATACGGQIVSW